MDLLAKGVLIWLACFGTFASCLDIDDITLDSRIVNGRNSTRGQFPHQALLFVTFPGGQRGACGGSLISNQWVLTAGHCVHRASSFEIHLGALQVNNTAEEGRVVHRTNNSVIHPRYLPLLALNDIALLKLERPVNFTRTVQPVRLPTAVDQFVDVNVTASGFGLQNTSATTLAPTLQYANLTTISNSECRSFYGFLTIRRSVICAIGRANQSTCNGDSGGPLVRSSDNTLIGLTSFGSPKGCHLGYPQGFTRVTHYLNWISHVTGENFFPNKTVSEFDSSV